MATFDGLADDIHMICRAVIGSQAGVLRNTATELRKDEHRHVVGAADSLHVVHESRDCIGNIGQQSLMQIRLLHVGVKGIVAIRRVVQARRHAGRDQRSDFRKLHRHDAVVDRSLVAGPGVAHQLRSLACASCHVLQVLPRRAGIAVYLRHSIEQCTLLVKPFAAELLRVVEHHGHMLTGAHGQRLHFIDVYNEIGGRARVDRIGNPAHPAVLLAAVRRTSVPIRHRCEMREGRLRIAATVHNCHLAVLIEPLEPRHALIEAEALVYLA